MLLTKEQYEAKFTTVEEAISHIKSGDTIAVGYYGCEPRTLMRKLDTIADRGVTDVAIWSGNPVEDYPLFYRDDLKGKIDILAPFYGPAHRKMHPSGRCSFVPNNLHSVSEVTLGTRKPTVFMAACTPMDRFGNVAISLSQQTEVELMRAADLVILEVNDKLPITTGTVHFPADTVDYFVHADCELSMPPEYEITDVQRKIAANIASLINDGDTLQFGIGGLPNAISDALMDKKDLGIHTEMFNSAMARLMQAGVVTNQRKNFHMGVSVATFIWGDQNLYDYVNGNPLINILPANYVNDPFNIAQNDNMVSVNTALQIDLTGQVCSESMGSTQWSGTGGATDYAYGAYHSKGGKGIIAISSTAKHGTISRIVPQLTQGAVVSISRNLVDYVITEYGIAHLKYASIKDRVEQLINIAHPDFRDDLRKQANELMLW